MRFELVLLCLFAALLQISVMLELESVQLLLKVAGLLSQSLTFTLLVVCLELVTEGV